MRMGVVLQVPYIQSFIYLQPKLDVVGATGTIRDNGS